MSIEVDLKRVLSLAIGAMLGYGPEPEIAQYALDTIEMAGYRVVPVVDDATRQEVEALRALLLDNADSLRSEGFTFAPKWTSRIAELLAAAYLGRDD